MTHRPVQSIQFRFEQRQIMTFALQQALQILQMPQLELAEWIRDEIERNPVLEQKDRPRASSVPSTLPVVAAKPTLREHLLGQIKESHLDEADSSIARYLIDQFDERGWLTVPLEEMPMDLESILRVLLVLQTFDPPGIGARNLQESLWLQLRKKPYSLAEILVRDHFADLLQGRFQMIQKRLHISSADLRKALHDLSRLCARPAAAFDDTPTHYIVPDLTITEIDPGFLLKVDEEELPIVEIREDYVALEPSQKEERETLRGWVTSAKWLQRSLLRRRNILRAIGRLLIRRQATFFTEMGEIVPIDIQELASLLNVHESTAWRAVASKTLACPRGLIPLRQFFSESAASKPLKELLHRLIQQEDKSRPLTDDAIMKKLQEHGFQCARRTIAKYRRAMHITPAARRKVLG